MRQNSYWGMRELTGTRRIFQKKFEEIGDGNLNVDILAGNLHHEKQVSPNREIEIAEPLIVQENLFDYSESSSEEDNASDVSNIDLTATVTWQEQPVTIDQRATHLAYNLACKINILSISLASPYTIFRRYLPIKYIEENIIQSINLCGKLKLEGTQPLLPFNFQRWMSILRFEQIVSNHTLMMPNELEISDDNDLLSSVRSFINAFNANLIEAVIPGSVLCIDESMNSWLGIKNKIPGCRKIPRKPHPVGQEWKILADGLTNIVIHLEPCEDKEIEKHKCFASDYGSTTGYVLRLTQPWFDSGCTIVGDSWFGSPKLCILLMQNGLYSIFHVKKRRGWPVDYPRDMVQKLDTSTTAKADEVEHVIKNNTSSTIVTFTRPKVFYEYSQAKGAVDINNQIQDHMTSFQIAEANAFLTYKKWNKEGHNISHFDFRRQLTHEMLNRNYNITSGPQVKTRSKTSELLHSLDTFPKRKIHANIF
ncbi:9605_t:CDS:2 [Entrophospora sp. SA101]|nr:9605_t:CDS:2 [Entrophospora sp. SA101]